MIVASPFGQMTAAHANTLELRVNGGMVSGDPIVTSSGDFVRLTWTWIATTSGEQQISVEASIQIQSGTPIQSGMAISQLNRLMMVMMEVAVVSILLKSHCVPTVLDLIS